MFVITFSRAGEDNKSFKVTDIEQTFAGFAGADYDLQVLETAKAAFGLSVLLNTQPCPAVVLPLGKEAMRAVASTTPE